MRLVIVLMAGLAAGPGLAAAQARPAAEIPAVEIKDAVARVTVIPEDRADIRVEVLVRNRRLPLKVRNVRDRTIVEGELDGSRIVSCRGAGERATVRIAGLGDVAFDDMPYVVVRTPRDVDVSAGGAVFGAVGRARSVRLGAAGCGDWTVANVEQGLQINLAGSGDARSGASGQARLRVTGSGDIAAAAVRGGLAVDLAGSGNVRVASMAGPLDVHVAGSGDVAVLDGRASRMSVSMAGSGDVEFGGVADSLTARIAGSGDVRARAVRGAVRTRVLGSGRVRIGDR